MVFRSSPPPGGECRGEEETRSGDDGEEDGDEYDDSTIAFVVVGRRVDDDDDDDDVDEKAATEAAATSAARCRTISRIGTTSGDGIGVRLRCREEEEDVVVVVVVVVLGMTMRRLLDFVISPLGGASGAAGGSVPFLWRRGGKRRVKNHQISDFTPLSFSTKLFSLFDVLVPPLFCLRWESICASVHPAGIFPAPPPIKANSGHNLAGNHKFLRLVGALLVCPWSGYFL